VEKNPMPDPIADRPPSTRLLSRRSLLGKTATLMGGMGVGGLLAPARSGAADGAQNLPPNIPEWSREQGAPVIANPYGTPSPYEKNVVRRTVQTPTSTAAASWTPLQDLHGIITPNGLVYERHHAGVPTIDPEQHRLIVHGLVDRPLIFTMGDLMRFPSVSRLYFLECSGNTQGWKAGSPNLTVQNTHGLLSCCEWTGVLLSTVLDEVGIKPEAKWLLAESADAAGMDRSVPMAKALDDAMLVYSQNGERLRPEQGYPLRLFLPGYEGNMSIKWLRRIKLGTQPFHTREETSKYTDLMPDGKARQFTFLMEAKSVITHPSGGHQLREPGLYEISGLAWSGHGKIRSVDVSTDGGATWRAAQLQEPVLDKCLTRFRLPWRWEGGPALLLSRAIDETGYVQPKQPSLVEARGLNSFYHFNGIHTWKLAADGRVSNGV
jgi:sulfane dehydrogenase subunit SoxC